MGKKKKNKEVELFFCYYCDRQFSDEAALVVHQKNKRGCTGAAWQRRRRAVRSLLALCCLHLLDPSCIGAADSSMHGAVVWPSVSGLDATASNCAPTWCADFKCPECNRKMNTAQGLATHAYQVHKLAVNT